jgi:hypothetical protein
MIRDITCNRYGIVRDRIGKVFQAISISDINIHTDRQNRLGRL